VAVDAAGNVYIADTNNNRVLKETLANGVYTPSTIADATTSVPGGATGLHNPAGVAVDAAGDVYIADTSHNRVLKETLANGVYTISTLADATTSVPGGTTGLNAPYGVATDAAGDVYIVDSIDVREVLTSAPAPTATPTNTAVPPTNTAVPPTNTAVPPANTATNTAVPPTAPVNTATDTVVPPTNTATNVPPTSTAVPPTDMPANTATNTATTVPVNTATTVPFVFDLHVATPATPPATPVPASSPPFAFDAHIVGPATTAATGATRMERVMVHLVTTPHAPVVLRLTLTSGNGGTIRHNGKRHTVHGWGYRTLYTTTLHLTADGAGRVQRTLTVAYTPTRPIVGQVTLSARTARGTLSRGWTVHLAPAPHTGKK